MATASSQKAPPVSHFPSYPAAWYFLGKSNEFNQGIIRKHLFGRELVAFRTESGKLAVLDSRCSHLSADLGRGRVVGECLQCPFHHWQYGPTGECQHIPGNVPIPEFAKQRSYPVVERNELIFVWNGTSPAFELPFFAGENSANFQSGRPFHFIADCSWVMLVSNAFDGQHFQAVHDRRLLSPPKIDASSAFWPHTIELNTEIVGTSFYDRMLKYFIGKKVRVVMANHGGPLVLVTAYFKHATSYILVAANPLAADKVLVEVIVFAQRSKNPLKQFLTRWCGLELRRFFTQGFMQDDIVKLPGIKYNPNTLIKSDQILIDFFHWLASLPSE